MKRVKRLPQAFREYDRIGGVLNFATFEDADGDIKSAIVAVGAIVKNLDQVKLMALGSRPIDDKLFYGDSYRADGDVLVHVGHFTSKDGRDLENPTDPEMLGLEMQSGSTEIPEAGSGGQFAYAFCHPPYSLSARPWKIQDLFYEIRDYVLPPNTAHEISDWSSPSLVEVSDYFSRGMQWWGVFLFTIYVPELRRLTAISGSATD